MREDGFPRELQLNEPQPGETQEEEGIEEPGEGWAPTGAATNEWQPVQEMGSHKRAAAEQAVTRIDRRHWISAGAGGERGTRGKDGFQQELQQRVAARGDRMHWICAGMTDWEHEDCPHHQGRQRTTGSTNAES